MTTDRLHIVIPAPAGVRHDIGALRRTIDEGLARLVTEAEVLDEAIGDDQVAVRVTLAVNVQCVVATPDDDDEDL